MLTKIEFFINEIIPESVRPTFFNLTITALDIEFMAKIISLGLSSAYLIYKWNKDLKNDNKKNNHE